MQASAKAVLQIERQLGVPFLSCLEDSTHAIAEQTCRLAASSEWIGSPQNLYVGRVNLYVASIPRGGDWSAYENVLKGATMRLLTTHEPGDARPAPQVRCHEICTER
jgi:hypothetical protein